MMSLLTRRGTLSGVSAMTELGTGAAAPVWLGVLIAADMGPDAVKADGRATIGRMKRIPTDDLISGKGRIRRDGPKIHDMLLFEVRRPEESRYSWDYRRRLADTPAEQAHPEQEGGCNMVKS